MATDLASLDINVNPSGAVRGAKTAVGALSDVSDAAERSTSVTRKLRNAFIGLGGVVAFTVITKKSNQFSKAMREVSTLIDTTVWNMNKLEDAAHRLSVAFGAALTDIAGGLYDIISAGASSTEDALERLEVAMELATAGKATPKEGADLLTSGLNTFAFDMLTADQVADSFFKTVQKGKTTIPELAASMGQVMPIAAAAGISLDHLNASIATMTTAGVKTPQATTGIKAALNAIVKPLDESLNVAKNLRTELGEPLKFNAIHLKEVGWLEFLKEVDSATGGRLELLEKLIPSVEALAGWKALTGNMQLFLDTASEYEDKAGVVAGAVEKMTAGAFSFEAATSLLSRELKILGDWVVGYVSPVLSKMVTIFDAWGISIQKVLGSLVILYAGWGAFIGIAFQLWVTKFAKDEWGKIFNKKGGFSRNMRAVSLKAGAFKAVLYTLGLAFKSLWKIAKAFGKALLFNPIVRFIAIAVGLIAMWRKYRDVIEPLGEGKGTLGDYFTAWGDYISSAITKAKDALVDWWRTLAKYSFDVESERAERIKKLIPGASPNDPTQWANQDESIQVWINSFISRRQMIQQKIASGVLSNDLPPIEQRSISQLNPNYADDYARILEIQAAARQIAKEGGILGLVTPEEVQGRSQALWRTRTGFYDKMSKDWEHNFGVGKFSRSELIQSRTERYTARARARISDEDALDFGLNPTFKQYVDSAEDRIDLLDQEGVAATLAKAAYTELEKARAGTPYTGGHFGPLKLEMIENLAKFEAGKNHLKQLAWQHRSMEEIVEQINKDADALLASGNFDTMLVPFTVMPKEGGHPHPMLRQPVALERFGDDPNRHAESLIRVSGPNYKPEYDEYKARRLKDATAALKTGSTEGISFEGLAEEYHEATDALTGYNTASKVTAAVLKEHEARVRKLKRSLRDEDDEPEQVKKEATDRLYTTAGVAIMNKQLVASERLKRGIEEVIDVQDYLQKAADAAGKKPLVSVAMRDREIKALKKQHLVFGSYLEQLEKENELIGKTALEVRLLEAAKKALIANDYKSLNPNEAKTLEDTVTRNEYNKKGVSIAKEYLTTQEKIAIKATELFGIAKANKGFSEANATTQLEIYKQENISLDEHIRNMQRENIQIGKNTLAYEAEKASLEAVNEARSDFKGDVTPKKLKAVGDAASHGIYREAGVELNEQYSSDVDKINTQLERFNALREKGIINEETFKSAAMDTYSQYDLVLGNIDSSRAKIYQSIEDSSAQLTDALVEGALTGKLSFASFTDAIIKDLWRMSLRASITIPLMNAIYGLSSYGFGFGATTPLPATGGGGVNYGGYAKDGGYLTSEGFADGGGVNLPNFMRGGDAMGHVKGPGGPRDDKILARLSNGEFVINAEATKNHRQLLEDINDNKFAYGGHVGSGGNSYQRSSGSGDKPNVNINVYNSAAGVETETEAEPNAEGGIDVSVMVRTITNQIASETAKGKGLAPVLQKRYRLNPAAGMR